MVKVVVTAAGDDLEQQRQRSRVDDALAMKNETPSTSAFWFFDGDEELKHQYLTFCSSDCNVPALFVVFLVNLVILIIRGCWWRSGDMNSVFFVTYPLSVVLASLGSLNFYMRASLWTPLATYPFPQESIMFRVRTFFQKLNESSLLCMLLSDSAIILFSVLSGLNVLGRAMMGPCAPGASFWDTQYCNPDGPGR
jgi:hypothetical protein